MKFTKRSVIAMLLVLCTLALAACGGGNTTETEPKETEPVVTEPVVTEPDATEETDPVVTDPVVTEPKETDPVETDPVVTDPVVTEPKETEPKETEPKETEPKETEPKETEPKETEPSVGPHTCVGSAITSEPTCAYPGTIVTICTTCGKVMSEEVYADPLPCTPDEANPATCEKAQYCLVCKLVVVEPLGHKFVSAYATVEDEPTCSKEGTLTYTCERHANEAEHVEGSAGAAYTEKTSTVAHKFVGETTLTASTLLTPATETGTCQWCGEGAVNEYETGVYEDFENLETDSKFVDVFESSAFGTDFNGSINNGSVLIGEDAELGNKYLVFNTNKQGGLSFQYDQAALTYETFEIAFKFKASDTASSGRVITLTDKNKNNNEASLLSYYSGRLVFGKNEAGGYVVIRNNDVIVKDGEYQWVDIRIVVDPVNYAYEIYVNGELALYTTRNEDGTANVYTVADGVETLAKEKITQMGDVKTNPVRTNVKFDRIYMLHYSTVNNLMIDDFSVRIPKVHECVTETVTQKATCVEPGYTIEKCTICGAEFEETFVEIPASGEHVYAIEAATCTDAKACTVCGEVAEAALGHEGTTIIPATISTPGSEKGHCTRCDKDIDVAIAAGIVEDFENMSGLTVNDWNNNSAFAVDEVEINYDDNWATNGELVTEENGNTYFKKKTGTTNGLYIIDTSADKILSGSIVELSFKYQLFSGGSNCSIIGIKTSGTQGSTGGTETRILCNWNGFIRSGTNNGTSHTDKITGDGKWYDLRVVLDTTTYDHKVWINGELVTETDYANNAIYCKDASGAWVSRKPSGDSDKNPYNVADNAPLTSFYLFHFNNSVSFGIDDLKLAILDSMPTDSRK